MNSSDVFYLCPTCFAALTQHEDNHAHRMIAVPILNLPLDQRRPLSDAQGHLLTQAPRWFVTLTFPLHAGRAG
ncbi:hypothetical protein [Candidatus Amarolinea aalborgensis]|jgi:hypothetical protein|uniref:hypothetical protein n=1 Tax=Candidatus Amarolinea aalborgensis TaxID=2249329 RepID=UPI003BF96B41